MAEGITRLILGMDEQRVCPSGLLLPMKNLIEGNKGVAVICEEAVDRIKPRETLVHVGEGDLQVDQVNGTTADKCLRAFQYLEIEPLGIAFQNIDSVDAVFGGICVYRPDINWQPRSYRAPARRPWLQ